MKYLVLLIMLISFNANAAQLSWKNMLTGSNLPQVSVTGSSLNELDINLAQQISPGTTAYIQKTGDGSADNDYSKVLYVGGCKTVTLMFFPNIDNITASATATGDYYYTATGNPSALGTGADAAAYKLTADINDTRVGIDNYSLTGDPGNASTDYDGLGDDNRGWIDDVNFPLIQARVTNDPPNLITAQFLVVCK